MDKGKIIRSNRFSDEELNTLLVFLASYLDLVSGQFGKKYSKFTGTD